ncbi:hypothetical protein A9Q99_04955 [Gammaproteobacteria bacterium 45_16_T64]|nr:hypothetical protein A9Q99_04955 [Gammaproteobacteria bacterium 45_16_T64]
MNELIILLITTTAVGYWYYSAKSRELAISEAKRLCNLDQLQLLDQTVALQRQWLARNNNNRWFYCRQFIFEFTTTGEQRYQGRILVIAGKVVKSDIDAYRID